MNTLRISAVVATTVLLSGCWTPRTYVSNCAWCKSAHARTGYVYCSGNKKVYVARSPGSDMPSKEIGRAKSWLDAQQMMANDCASRGFDADGYKFCSLRCINAYRASKGVQEERIRVIPHE